jgi:DNA-binding MarR family transcriptional regulator
VEGRVDLQLLDEALVRLRRLWTASRAHVVDDLGRRVEMSSVLVVEACARAEADAVEVTVGDVAAFLDVAPSTASRLVERTAAAGLVRRDASTVNGRRAALRLTDAGHVLRARATAARLGWLSGVVADWPPADVQALGSALTRFADAVAASPPAAGRGRGASSHLGGDGTAGEGVQ